MLCSVEVLTTITATTHPTYKTQETVITALTLILSSNAISVSATIRRRFYYFATNNNNTNRVDISIGVAFDADEGGVVGLFEDSSSTTSFSTRLIVKFPEAGTCSR